MGAPELERLSNPFLVSRDYIHDKGRNMNAFKWNKIQKVLAVVLMIGMSAGVYAAKGGVGIGRGGGSGGGKPVTTETAANNLSFPIILAEDEVRPGNFPSDAVWKFAAITDPSSQCVLPWGEVLPTKPCYYGSHVTVISETGEIVFDGDPQVWWLQKRSDNFWKALIVHHDPDPNNLNITHEPLIVSAVDVGDLLESTPDIAPRMIRVEFNLLQDVSNHAWLSSKLPALEDWSVDDGTGYPSKCHIPGTAIDETNHPIDADNPLSIGCFAALGMSGAVPGTEQSGSEIQGTDFGFGPNSVSAAVGTQQLVNTTKVRSASYITEGVDGEGQPIEVVNDIPVHALVYSSCARLTIQKISDIPIVMESDDPNQPMWVPTEGKWSVGNQLINVATYAGNDENDPAPWSVEITSSGSIVYGFNWNAKTAGTGLYRLTFVLDGNDLEGPKCPTTLKTAFGSAQDDPVETKLVNVGEHFTPNIIPHGDSSLGDEGGLVYIDIPLTAKGGGGGGKPE